MWKIETDYIRQREWNILIIQLYRMPAGEALPFGYYASIYASIDTDANLAVPNVSIFWRRRLPTMPGMDTW